MSDFLTLGEIVNLLQSLAKSQATGRLCIVNEAKHTASFDLDLGCIVSIRFRILSGERAIAEIAKIKQGTCRFEAYTAAPNMLIELPPNDEIFAMLMATQDVQAKAGAGPVRAVDASKQAAPPVTAATTAKKSLATQQRVKLALMEELGPMGQVLVDGVLACSTVAEITTLIGRTVDNPAVAKATVSRVVEALQQPD